MNAQDHDPGCGVDVAAYALGALEPAEAEAFERHLESCAVCQEELSEFRPVVDVLPLTAPTMKAPRALKRRVLREVRHSSEPASSQAGANRPTRPSRRLRVLAPAAALAVLIAAVVFAVTSGPGETTRTYSAQVIGTTGSAHLAVTGGHGELIVRHLAPPPRGKIYEVWIARPHRAPAPTTALFSVTRDGSGDVEVPGNLRGVTQVMVTPEPAGGSRVPTHAPVISVRI
jgi:anti-sigma-K factor RskA